MNRREKRQLNIGSPASLSTVWAVPIGSAFLFEIEILNLKSIKFNVQKNVKNFWNILE